MADEITVLCKLKVKNGTLDLNYTSGSVQFDQAAARGGNPGTVNIGTSDEALALGDITTPGWCYMINLDATNYVDIGPEDTGAIVPFLRLEPGEPALMRLSPSVTVRGQANTAACNVYVAVLED